MKKTLFTLFLLVAFGCISTTVEAQEGTGEELERWDWTGPIIIGPPKPPVFDPPVFEEEEEEDGCSVCNSGPPPRPRVIFDHSYPNGTTILAFQPPTVPDDDCSYTVSWSFTPRPRGSGVQLGNNGNGGISGPTGTAVYVCSIFVVTAPNGDYCGRSSACETHILGGRNPKQSSLLHETGITNYPNPFQNQTTLSYQLSDKATVSLRIVDIMGRNLSVPVSQQAQEAGQYRIPFEADNLSTGFYFAILEVDGQQYVHKMLINR